MDNFGIVLIKTKPKTKNVSKIVAFIHILFYIFWSFCVNNDYNFVMMFVVVNGIVICYINRYLHSLIAINVIFNTIFCSFKQNKSLFYELVKEMVQNVLHLKID